MKNVVTTIEREVGIPDYNRKLYKVSEVEDSLKLYAAFLCIDLYPAIMRDLHLSDFFVISSTFAKP